MKKNPEKVKKEIVNLKRKGLTVPDISKKLKVSDFTVKKYTKNVVKKSPRNKGGRPRKIPDVVSKKVINAFKAQKVSNLSTGKMILKKKYDIDVTKQTVRNLLLSNGIKCWVKRKKPLLTERNKGKRYEFARKYKNYSYFEWKRVIWSDECKFALKKNNWIEYC
jgi:transposase